MTQAPAPASPRDPRVAAAQAGDSRAFEGLYREHVDRVYGLCLRLCGGDVRRAEEAVQRTFVRAWSRLDRFEGRSAFGTWLHRIAVRIVLDQDKSAWFRRVRGLLPDRGQAPANPTARLEVERALATLPPKARRVLVLHDLEGWRHRDIAEAMGVSIGTSKSQLSRARRLLRERLS